MGKLLRRLRSTVRPPVDLKGITAHIDGPSVIVVSKSRPDIFEYLQQSFADDAEVEVQMDQRTSFGRRRAKEFVTANRRKTDRRRPPTFDKDLALKDFVIIPR